MTAPVLRHGRRGLLALTLAAALPACGGDSSRAALLACPEVGLLPDAADLIRYREGMPPDLTGLVLEARITGIESGRCSTGRERNRIMVSFQVGLLAERGPGATGRSQELPLVVAVLDRQGEILRREVLRQQIIFPANSNRVRIASEPIEIVLPVSATRRGSDYDVVVGFLLTEAELAANRRRMGR
ncbi:MAG: hypothetical protein N2588_12505 [Rhodovarius sp.]|nr:hypothetical protein [Rhodovarius sp.]